MPRNPKRSLGTRAYANYTPATLQACLRAIKSKQMTQRKASEHYKIPRSTIKNKLKVLHSNSVGHPTAFTPAVEASFAQHCMKLADFGFPLIPSDLKMCVTRYLDCKGVRVSQFTNNIPGDDWIRGFLKRNKDLSLKVSANIKKSRANITTDDINDYMDRSYHKNVQ
ncbi:uncharacterized protein LOC111032485 [Myzus persicae]|uniref:uncharacterized protein LOC111032485 n=1 Tax=Myzus persicae TaxID=13164 RepID=UPI000B9319B9|nr:uncharacterized protein LOC111032485 [Myzus persicae]